MSEEKKSPLEAIQELTEALEAGAYTAAPPAVALHVSGLGDTFTKGLSLAAAAVMEKSTKGPWDPSKFRCFTGICQWPVKEWYHAACARALNKLVAANAVEEVVGTVRFQMVTSGYVSVLDSVDNGPDEYAMVGFVFISPLKDDELNEILGDKFVSSNGELHAKRPSWYALGKRRSLVSVMLRQVDGVKDV